MCLHFNERIINFAKAWFFLPFSLSGAGLIKTRTSVSFENDKLCVHVPCCCDSHG